MTTTFERQRGVSGNQRELLDIAFAVAEFHRAFNLPVQRTPSTEIDQSLAREAPPRTAEADSSACVDVRAGWADAGMVTVPAEGGCHVACGHGSGVAGRAHGPGC
jgi:hypothetical protein